MTTAKRITVNVLINNEHAKQSAVLEGFAYVDSGLLAGSIDRHVGSLTIPELTLATAFTYTGCPLAARTNTPENNPWAHTSGAYRGTRILKFPGVEAQSTIDSRMSDDRIVMDLEVSVFGHLPHLKGIAGPFQEEIRQIDRGRFRGIFDISFSTEDSATVNASATTIYKLSVNDDYATVWRNITIINSCEPGLFRQIEQIDMFSDKNAAEENLQQRKNVS